MKTALLAIALISALFAVAALLWDRGQDSDAALVALDSLNSDDLPLKFHEALKNRDIKALENILRSTNVNAAMSSDLVLERSILDNVRRYDGEVISDAGNGDTKKQDFIQNTYRVKARMKQGGRTEWTKLNVAFTRKDDGPWRILLFHPDKGSFGMVFRTWWRE